MPCRPSHHPFFPVWCPQHIAAVLAGLLLSAPVAAQEIEWGLGLGVASSQTAYTDMKRDHAALPMLYVENRHMRFFGTDLEIKLPGLRFSETQRLDFNLIGRYDGSGYKADDAWILNGMAKRKGGIWGGLGVEWQTSLASLQADWTHDLSGHSKGQRLHLEINRAWQLGERFTLTPRLAATWHDGNYVDYYYGVRASEVRWNRPGYHPASAMNTSFGLRGVYRFDQHHTVTLDLQASRLASAIRDSPLVDRSTVNHLFLGYMYRF
ncbi:MipA/OmpV family protein [Corticimicrobacter populi]|uniref:MipA/OmpV family protein n=1 Tax=Corticimicrobacter populi TaxID=2175229 RepID=A0A2V1K0N9_9BURK|nr:MipA/OmpV family protein [Corticimicrobacter populi]PWF24766.1 MipA/OmpV family protein [Corticimicrobacter populi]